MKRNEDEAVESGEYDSNRVLIVDDQPEIHDDFREMLTASLRGTSADDLAAAFTREPDRAFLPPFELLHASGGDEACHMVRSARAADRLIAVAYVDVRMPPGIDGVETTRRLREIDPDIEIVLMTAYTDKSLSEIVRGMTSLHKLLYMRKPFSREEIQQITLSLVGKWNIQKALSDKQRLLATSYQRLQAVLDATGDAMAMHDADGNLVFANKGFEALCGMTERELKTLSPEAVAARFEERFEEPALLRHDDGYLFVEGDDAIREASVAPMPARRLFYRTTAPVRDGRQETIGHLRVYRDVSREIEVERMKAEVLRLRAELEGTWSFEGIVGDSPGMRQVFALMQPAIESDVTVLIRGESGTGKELVARSFHVAGPRRAGPFLAINCSAVSETLIESELFGHERGAFTGAIRQKIGFFERAAAGTIFLDEIGDMPVPLQAKLLRVLQEREIFRVGGTLPIAVDVRVIAATNKDLDAAVKDGAFREDLFYRLAVFPVDIPPLRERREDIPALAEHFLEKHTERLGKTIGGFSRATLQAILQYDWPGNVRELENAIERAVLLETSEVLQAGSLPPELSPTVPAGRKSTTQPAILPLEEIERSHIAHALEVSAYNIADAAQALGVNRATLYRKLKKLNLPSQPPALCGTTP